MHSTENYYSVGTLQSNLYTFGSPVSVQQFFMDGMKMKVSYEGKTNHSHFQANLSKLPKLYPIYYNTFSDVKDHAVLQKK